MKTENLSKTNDLTADRQSNLSHQFTDDAETHKDIRPVSPQWHAQRTEHGLNVQVNLPGVEKKDIDISFVDGQLRLRAHRPQPTPYGDVIYGEPAPEHYELQLRVGRSLDVEKTEAKLDLGVLNLEIPLVEEAKPQNIKIR